MIAQYNACNNRHPGVLLIDESKSQYINLFKNKCNTIHWHSNAPSIIVIQLKSVTYIPSLFKHIL